MGMLFTLCGKKTNNIVKVDCLDRPRKSLLTWSSQGSVLLVRRAHKDLDLGQMLVI